VQSKPFAPCILTSTQRTEAIRKAQKRVVYCGPGISTEELDAILSVKPHLSHGSLQVLVDLNLSAFQAGYWGEFEPAKLKDLLGLQGHAEQASGFRLGILIVDESAYLYTPTPLSLESDKLASREPNCLLLDPEETQKLYGSIVSESREGSIPQRPPISAAAIGQVTQQLLATSYTPPSQKRVLDRLRERLSIVQFQVSGYQLSRRNLQLPREVVEVLGSQEKGVNERLMASWRVFKPEADKELAGLQTELDKTLAEIKKKYLKRLSHYGFGLAHNVQPDFDAAWNRFQEEQVAAYQVKLRDQVDALIHDSQRQLKQLLMERATSGQLKIPKSPSLFERSDEEERAQYVHRLVDSVRWPKPDEVAEGVHFKMWSLDIAPELLGDQQFVGELEKEFNFKLSDLEDNATPDTTFAIDNS